MDWDVEDPGIFEILSAVVGTWIGSSINGMSKALSAKWTLCGRLGGARKGALTWR
jgi:hypothetical protein